MVDRQPEVTTTQHSPHVLLNNKLFESAYEPPRDDGSTVQYAFNGSGRSRTDASYPPPLSVADANGNILTNSENSVNKDSLALEQQSAEKTEAAPEPKPEEAPEEKAAGDKKVDPNLPPELQNEAKLMETLSGQQRTLIETSFQNIGKELWAQHKDADITGHGRYGCAAAESINKQQAGYDYVDSPLVSGVVNQLMKNGWTKHPFDERQPGDTIVRHKHNKSWKKGGGDAHIGTVGADINFAYNNHSDTQTWEYKPINESFNPRHKRFVLRPPEDGTLVARSK